jgi:4-hydroxy-3-polyprenylbenzoate decarboxylase
MTPPDPETRASAERRWRLALLVTGASGMELPRILLQVATRQPEVERLHLVVSAGASQVLRHEPGLDKPGAAALVEAAGLAPDASAKVLIHTDRELDAPIASGSYRLDGTVVLPCSSSTLGCLATGVADRLVSRAGAVALKERWPLILGFRETPLTLVHLENLRRLAYAGAIVLPPIPAFYVGGEDLARFAEAYATRVLDHLGLEVTRDDLRWPPP